MKVTVKTKKGLKIQPCGKPVNPLTLTCYAGEHTVADMHTCDMVHRYIAEATQVHDDGKEECIEVVLKGAAAEALSGGTGILAAYGDESIQQALRDNIGSKIFNATLFAFRNEATSTITYHVRHVGFIRQKPGTEHIPLPSLEDFLASGEAADADE